MNQLQETIQELYEIEPFWAICNPCQCQGYCCVGANISVTDDELNTIKEYIRSLPDIERETIKQNLIRGRNCIFRAENECLIHEVRPENCRYTPYQAAIDQHNVLRYAMAKIDTNIGRCYFSSREEQLTSEAASEFRKSKFLLLPNFDRMTHYICLNNLFEDQTRQSTHRISDLADCILETC